MLITAFSIFIADFANSLTVSAAAITSFFTQLIAAANPCCRAIDRITLLIIVGSIIRIIVHAVIGIVINIGIGLARIIVFAGIVSILRIAVDSRCIMVIGRVLAHIMVGRVILQIVVIIDTVTVLRMIA